MTYVRIFWCMLYTVHERVCSVYTYSLSIPPYTISWANTSQETSCILKEKWYNHLFLDNFWGLNQVVDQCRIPIGRWGEHREKHIFARMYILHSFKRLYPRLAHLPAQARIKPPTPTPLDLSGALFSSFFSFPEQSLFWLVVQEVLLYPLPLCH